MPSPFPGMDPYLEGAEWTSFHAEFATEVARQLRPQLRPRYVALAMRYFITDTFDGSDIPEQVPQCAVEIQDVAKRRLVTLIEILSPSKKRGKGYDEYVAKRQRVLLSTTHLQEIDLLRNGQRAPLRQPLPPSSYFIFLSRYEKRPMTDIWQIALNQSLPVVPIPLLPSDKDVTLDLQLALTTIYDSVGYDLVLNYTKPPDVPLEEKAAQWAATLLKNQPIQ